MKITLVPGRELSSDLIDRWRQLQRSNPDLANPFFCPEFTQIVASVRDDVEVAVIEEAKNVAAFFPFQRGPASVGLPVGGILSDYQGVICRPEFSFEPKALVQRCGLIAWDFDHLLASQKSFEEFHSTVELSPQLDLSKGYETYFQQQQSARSMQKKVRGLQNAFGPLRLEAHDASANALQTILSWKSQQYLRTGKTDLFSISWIRAAVERIHATQTESFSGRLSMLYAGDRVVAGRFGMHAGAIYHAWFPAYNREMAKYSPGLVLLLKQAEHAPSIGVRTIDLGKGMRESKQRFMNASATVASGSVELLSWRFLKRRTLRKARSLLASSPLEKPLRDALSKMRRLRVTAR